VPEFPKPIAPRRLRVGFLSPCDSGDPEALSGMPFRMRETLESHGLEMMRLDGRDGARREATHFDSLRRRAPESVKQGWRFSRQRVSRFVEWLRSRGHEQKQLRLARLRAAALSRKIREAAPDVLFGCCISTMLFELETDVPIVYFSDATARLINETYPRYRSRSPGYKRRCDAYEREAMSRAFAGVFATRVARDSAVGDYGLPAARAHLAPMGAHITPDDLRRPGSTLRPAPPTRDHLQLCIIASDARRKRVGLAVEVTDRLAASGWNATLTHIGQPCAEVRRSGRVRSLGPLRLSVVEERRKMAAALAHSHFLLLPSVGEAYGIAPCEAAHFGRPSIVSDAGGLAEVVQHGRTGLVLPVQAQAQRYAEAIMRLAVDAAAYRRMSHAALARAKTVLNWEAWALQVVPLIHEAAGRGRPLFTRRAEERETESDAHVLQSVT